MRTEIRTEIITCDGCHAQISVVYEHSSIEGEFCFECLRKATAPPVTEECPHDENASDAVPGRSTARLVCKACGYDRDEAVA